MESAAYCHYTNGPLVLAAGVGPAMPCEGRGGLSTVCIPFHHASECVPIVPCLRTLTPASQRVLADRAGDEARRSCTAPNAQEGHNAGGFRTRYGWTPCAGQGALLTPYPRDGDTGANAEDRTRVTAVEAQGLTIRPRSRDGPSAGVDPARCRLQNGCSTLSYDGIEREDLNVRLMELNRFSAS